MKNLKNIAIEKKYVSDSVDCITDYISFSIVTDILNNAYFSSNSELRTAQINKITLDIELALSEQISNLNDLPENLNTFEKANLTIVLQRFINNYLSEKENYKSKTAILNNIIDKVQGVANFMQL